MIEQWRKQLQELSGNITTNEVMPQRLVDKLLDEDGALKEKLVFKEVSFPELDNPYKSINGLNILAGLQKYTKKGNLTLFRAIRFPTYKRMYEMVSDSGYGVSNYEQERILELYKNGDYIQKREDIKNNHRFWTQPQERVVHGLPLFCLVNDALQIHRAFRGENDKVALVAIHIPHELFERGRVRLIANTAIDSDYNNEDRDYEIKDFYKDGEVYEIDFESLRARGIDLHEMYSNDLPLSIKNAERMGITQDFFLLDIYKFAESNEVNTLFNDTSFLKKSKYFMHGFFGDQNIFGRRRTKYLPYKCFKILRA